VQLKSTVGWMSQNSINDARISAYFKPNSCWRVVRTYSPLLNIFSASTSTRAVVNIPNTGPSLKCDNGDASHTVHHWAEYSAIARLRLMMIPLLLVNHDTPMLPSASLPSTHLISPSIPVGPSFNLFTDPRKG
jgi:hypothetical protein